MQIHCFYLLLLFFIAIVIFIGHGSDPRSTFQMPPSSDGDTGRLIFLSREPKQSQLQGGVQVHSGLKLQDGVQLQGGGLQLTSGLKLQGGLQLQGGLYHSTGSASTGHFSSSEYNKSYDDLSDFQLAAGKTLFICQACYSGNTVSGMTKS